MAKNKLPFDKRGGVVVLPKRMMKSDVYLSLSPYSKVLVTLLQMHWRNDKPVDYGLREAKEKIPCAHNTAMNAFNELLKKGFIVLVDPAVFCSRTQSKSRTWRLTWLPFDYKPPTNDWENVEVNKNVRNSMGSNMIPM